MLLEKLMHLTPEEQVEAHQRRERWFPVRWIKAGDKPLALARAPKALGAEALMKKTLARAVLVLKDGKIVEEAYAPGVTEASRWFSFSVGKSIVSTLIGVALKEGAIGSLEDLVTKYLPQLKGSAYEDVTLHNILQMSSGVAWEEGYRDGTSSFAKMYNAIVAQQPGGVLKVMASLPRLKTPGTSFFYNTGETHVLVEVLTAAIGRPAADYLTEKIWQPFGMEADAHWTLESPGGQEIGGGSLSITLRDYGRLGLFLLGGGVAGGKQLLPDGWLERAGYPGAEDAQVQPGQLDASSPMGYGYKWWTFPFDGGPWPAHAGAFTGQGIFGQFLYLNPKERVVAVVWSTWPDPWVEDNERLVYDYLARAVETLRG